MTRTTALLLIFLLLATFLLLTLFAFTLCYIDLAYTFHHYQQTRRPHIESIEADRLRRQMEIERKVDQLLEIFGDVREFEVTAYTHAPPGGDINGTGDGLTSIGIPVREGIVAVDPRVIPYGSKVWLDGFGWLLAADTGGAIRGNRLDVFMDSKAAAFQWGRRTVKGVVVR